MRTTSLPCSVARSEARPEARPVRLLAAGTALAACLALSGCGGDDPAATPTTTVTATPSSPSASDGATDSSDQGDQTALLAAAQLVLDKVSGSTLTSIETDPGGWEVQVATADGSESQAVVAADGASITSGPTQQDDDAEDRRENQALLKAATLDVSEVVAAISKAAPGSITELNLDDHRGQVVWEADVQESGQPKVSVRVDAGAGAVVTQTTEAPGDDD